MLDRKRGFGSARLVTGGFGKSASSGDGAASKALAIFWLLLNDYHPRDFTISLWDGSEWPAENGVPRFTLKVRSPGALRRILTTGSNDLSVSESYIFGELDVTGDFEAAMPLATYLIGTNQLHYPGRIILAQEVNFGYDPFGEVANERSDFMSTQTDL